MANDYPESLLTITVADIARLTEEEYATVWPALGIIARHRGERFVVPTITEIKQ